MEQVLEKLHSCGYKITPQRRLILEVISSSGRHLTAEEVVEKIREVHPSISVATVYRNVNLMLQLEMLSKLDLHNGAPRYEVFQGHNHHMVCQECGAAIKLGVCPMQGEVLKAIENAGFKVDSHHFEIIGCCKACRAETE